MVQIRREVRRGPSNEKRQDHLGKVHHAVAARQQRHAMI
jgi:hypothetical protein